MTQQQAREQVMRATQVFMSLWDKNHGTPKTRADYAARLDYVNSQVTDYLSEQVKKTAI